MINDEATFDQVLERVSVLRGQHSIKSSLLLGNGFSIACWNSFNYEGLYERIKKLGINRRLESLFEIFQITDFESVLRVLVDAKRIASVYGFNEADLRSDYENLKDVLTKAISEIHPPISTAISDANYFQCYRFIKQFDDIYTVNYDLLLYWVNGWCNYEFGDYFGKEANITPDGYCEYLPSKIVPGKHLHFLHGALHFFQRGSKLLKPISTKEVRLVPQIIKELSEGNSPLIVAEGDSLAKLNHIKRVPYLSECFKSFSESSGHLLTYGFSFSEQDAHILNSIIGNPNIQHLSLGYYSGKGQILQIAEHIDSKRNEMQIPIDITLYSTRSVSVW